MPPSPSKFQGNPSGRGGSSAVDVSDADGKFCYSVPKRHISHYGVDGGGGRLVACRNYTAAIEQQKGGTGAPTGDRSASEQSTNSTSHSSNSRNSHHHSNGTPNSNCPMGHRCKFVHIDVPLSSMRSEPIHTHFVWKGPEQVSYEMLPPVIAKEQPQLTEKEISETLLTVFGPNNREPSEKLRADRVLMTRGARFAYEAAIGCPRSEDAPPCCHCAHYYFNQVCNRGPNCAFVHVISYNPTLSESHIKTSNFHRRISLLGEENLYSNGTDPVASSGGGHNQSAPVSRQPSQQRSGSTKEDSAIHSNNKNNSKGGNLAIPANGRGRAASFPMTNAEGPRNIAAELQETLQQRSNNQHQRNPSMGSTMLNPSVNSTPRVHVHVPTPPPVALGSTPKDPILLVGDDELRNSGRHGQHHQQHHRQNNNGTPPPPPSAQVARGNSGSSNMGGGRGVSIGASGANNTSNNSFISFNNAPMLATANSTPSASRRVSIGAAQDLSHPHAENAQNPTPTKFAGNQSTNSFASSAGNINNKQRVAESPPPPPPAQALIQRRPSQQGPSLALNQQQAPQQQSISDEVERQHSHVSYDDGFNANYQDYMSNGTQQPAIHNSKYNGNAGGQFPQSSAPTYGQQGGGYGDQPFYDGPFNQNEYSHGGPGYYQPPQQQQQFQQQYHAPQYYQQQPPPPPPPPHPQQQLRSPPSQRLQSPHDFHPKGPGLPPPPSYESSYGHLSLSSRPSSPHPPQYNASWSTAAGGGNGGSASNRQAPPLPQSQMPQSPPYPGSSQQQQQGSFPPRPHSNNIASIYQSNAPTPNPALPSPTSNPLVNAESQQQAPVVRVGGMATNPLGMSSSKRSDDYSSPEGLALGKMGTKASEGMQRQNSSRAGSTVLSDKQGVIAGSNSSPNKLGGDKNGDSMTSPPLHPLSAGSATATPTSSLDVTNKTSRYVHNPYSAGNGGGLANGSMSRSRTSSMTGPTPQMFGAILSTSQLPPPQVSVSENQVW